MVTNAAMKSGRRGMFNFLLFNSFGYVLRVSFSLPYKNPAGTSTIKSLTNQSIETKLNESKGVTTKF